MIIPKHIDTIHWNVSNVVTIILSENLNKPLIYTCALYIGTANFSDALNTKNPKNQKYPKDQFQQSFNISTPNVSTTYVIIVK